MLQKDKILVEKSKSTPATPATEMLQLVAEIVPLFLIWNWNDKVFIQT